MFLEQRQDNRIPLRDVETKRDLPRDPIVFARTKGNVEASFAIRKACEVISNVGTDSTDFEHLAPPGKA
jgi:hypothetical protein